jgi:signal transduction histidine kinase
VQHQSATAAIHRSTEAQWWWQLGGALIANLGIGLIAIFYAGRLEDRLRRQREKDRENARELQLLSARLVAAQEEERRTIARELHDEVGQVLSAIKVDLSVAQRALEQQGIAATALDEIQGLTDGALNTVRDLSQLLRPAVLDDLGLAAAVDGLLRAFARRHRVRVELVQEGSTDRLPIETEVAAFRIIQEALTNVARHAGASRCTVRLRGASGTLDVEIEDDGAGFDPAAAPTSRSGLGLVGIRERATELGGTVRVDAAPGSGTRIAVHLPAVHLSDAAVTVEATAPPVISVPDSASVSHG